MMEPGKQDSPEEMMVTEKRPMVMQAFLPLLRWTMKRRFHGVFIMGGDEISRLAADRRPLIICSNHTNWWDGFVAGFLMPLFGARDVYIAQHEGLLKQYPMCRWFGAFGIDIHGSPLKGVRYALKLLRRPMSAIWIFPQGVIVPQWVPIEVKPGALWLARKGGAVVLPVVFRYEWLVESRPSLFIHCGPPLPDGADDEALRKVMQELFDSMSASLNPLDLSLYVPLYRPRPSLNRWWDWIRDRL